MNQSSLIEKLEKLEDGIELVIGVSDTVSEYYYSWAPNQGIVPKLRHSLSRIKQFFIHSINSGKILSPLLIAQALLYFVKAGIAITRMALTRKIEKKSDVVEVVLDAVAGVLTTVIATLILLGSLKVAAIVYCVQAGVDVLISGATLIKQGFDYGRLTYQRYQLQKQLQLEKTPSKNINFNKQKIHEQIASIDQQRAKKLKAIKSSSKKLVLAGVILGLTIVGFFVPIPIVNNIAQVALAVIITVLVVKEVVERYQKYQAAKKIKQQQNNIKQDNETKVAEDTLTPKPQLASTKSNWKQKLMQPLLLIKNKIAGTFNKNKTERTKTANKVTIATAAALLTLATTVATADTLSNNVIAQPASIVTTVNNKDVKDKDTPDKDIKGGTHNNRKEKTRADDEYSNNSKSNTPRLSEDSVITEDKKNKFKKLSAYSPQLKYGGRRAAVEAYQQRFFAKKQIPKPQTLGVSDLIKQQQDDLRESYPAFNDSRTPL